MFNILQNCAIDSQIGFEVIAKAAQKIVNRLLSNALLQNAPDQDEHQLLLQVVVGDLCTLLSAGTFPLEFPIFTLFLKCLILDLIQFNYDYLLEHSQQSQAASERSQEKGEMNLAHKVLVLDYIQHLLNGIHKRRCLDLKSCCHDSEKRDLKCSKCQRDYHKDCINYRDEE